MVGIELLGQLKKELALISILIAPGREGENRDDDLRLVDRVRRLLLCCSKVISRLSTQNDLKDIKSQSQASNDLIVCRTCNIYSAWTISAIVGQTQM